MSQLSRDFDRLYHNILPPILRDILAGTDRQAFLDDRFKHIRVLKDEPIVSVSSESKFWNASTVEVAMPDLLFIADTILDLLFSMNLTIRVRVLALFDVSRKPDGALATMAPPAPDVRLIPEGHRRESWIFIATDPFDQAAAKQIESRLKRNLRDLRRMVDDYPSQVSFLEQFSFDSQALQEERLWLFENFVMMGTALIDGPADTSQAGRFPATHLSHCLGMLREREFRELLTAWVNRTLPSLQQKHHGKKNAGKTEKILVCETDIKSNVKQNKPLHCVLFFTAGGSVRLLLGSFAGKGELTPRFLIPTIHARLESIAHSFGGPRGSHTFREIFRLAQIIPLGLLFSRPDAMLRAWFSFMLEQKHAREAAYHSFVDTVCGGCWVLRTVFDEEEIGTTLRGFAAKEHLEIVTDFHRAMDGPTIHFLWFRSASKSGKQIASLIDANEETILTSWTDRFRRAVTRKLTGNLIRERMAEYVQALDRAAPVHLSPRQTLEGMLLLESLGEGEFRARLETTGWNREWALHIYTGEKRLLGDLTLVLDSCGLRVNRALELSFALGKGQAHRHIFYLEAFPGNERLRDIEGMVEGILNGSTTVDGLNELILAPGFNLPGIRLLKALLSFLYQLDRSISRISLSGFLQSHPDFSGSLIRLVDAQAGNKSIHRDEALNQVDMELAGLHNLTDQSAGRRFRDLVMSIVRTDWPIGLNEIAIKIETGHLEFAPEPRPHREIFVYAPDFEGVHVRSGPVSRGGIRWSDRPDDFRREILGLMATQRIKNTIIIPDGSKGGFVLTGNRGTNPGQPAERATAAISAYTRFMEALLRLTDNLEDGKPVHPPGIHCRDGSDPYLVVAADRGTATFSDTANQVAERFGFWLGDAFASGGRFGYDHKRQGITARGAWESVKAHFSQIGIDPEKEAFQVIGIGDMSGDVFGNGLLLSRNIRLIAAFNHRHIFVDPDPDPATSFEERRRLFRLGLDWNGYNRDLLSAGGGIYERDRADIRISTQARAVFDLKQSTISGHELIRAILRCEADLLWNGGIGTYVKSSSERHDEAGDPANDGVRVDGRDLRVRVVGEGGNLGFTMNGRYEAALHGVRLHTDAVDNSGGVDMSDHEVNLKILLQTLQKRRHIKSLEERNLWIRRLEPVMIRQVLENNRGINRAIVLEAHRWNEDGWLLALWLNELLEGGAVRENEIPAAASHWAQSGSIPGPFVCNLIGWSKLHYRSRLKLNPESHPEFKEILLQRFRDLGAPGTKQAALDHPLGEPIVRTEAINHIVHTGGTAFLFRLRFLRGINESDSIALRLELERSIATNNLREAIERLAAPGKEKMLLHLELEEVLFRLALLLPADFFARKFPRSFEPLIRSVIRYKRTHPSGNHHREFTPAAVKLLDRIRALPHAFRLIVAGINPLETGIKAALEREEGLPFDDIESAIRKSACQDLREMSFQGKLLGRLEEIRLAVLRSGGEEEIPRRWKKSLKEARRLLREHRMNAVLFHEILNDR